MKKLLILGSLLTMAAFGQSTLSTTTLSTALTQSATLVSLSSCPSIPAVVGGYPSYILFVDNEAMRVQSIVTGTAGNACAVSVLRGTDGSIQATHSSGAVVYGGQGPDYGNQWLVDNANGFFDTGEVFIPASNCVWAPTTLTVTNTYPQIGTAFIPVVNGTTNAAAGTLTLSCSILPNMFMNNGRGLVIKDIVALVGSQTVAPTSVGTATLGTITFPTPAASETASTVTPVSIGGTVSTVSPSQITSVTTAGSFLSIRSTFSSPVLITADLQSLVYHLPFGQTAASAMTLNSPGLLVHVAWY
ncbi:MAG TPA: hypothetical protein VHI13_08855 [Candidatus Kapabacteria bacterium]|nr:hypothetical protein [Candidatus Kapabacteria bacterium]